MDIRQLSNIKRIGTWLVSGLMVLSLGLMLLGWTVPTRAAFDAGVLGFQLFPVAVSAVLVRILLPLILNTLPGRAFIRLASPVIVSFGATIAWLWNRAAGSGNMAAGPKTRVQEQSETRDNAVMEHVLYRENPEIGIHPLEYIPEDPILRPKEYRPNFNEMFDDDGFDT